MFVIKDLCASYGGIKALRGISLEVNKGEIVAVLGSNGAGKSTLLKTISGMQRADSGSISFYGRIVPTTPFQVVKSGIAHVPEGRQIFPDLTVLQNLMIGAFLRKDHESVNKDLHRVYELFRDLRNVRISMEGY